eukprot:TRINITY_DN8248_c1_g1_i3.p1 TRINITY_DN8248_c1_g1~~TRINITY_DN8248_c1_g1_i3.p1  ORF type:complete len:451 (+),score=118.72 TRINITY_DN8248_c1_g1_i3:95-1447(+)
MQDWCIEVSQNSPRGSPRRELAPGGAQPGWMADIPRRVSEVVTGGAIPVLEFNNNQRPQTQQSGSRGRGAGGPRGGGARPAQEEPKGLTTQNSLAVPRRSRKMSMVTEAFYQAQRNASFMRKGQANTEKFEDNNEELDYYCDGADGQEEFLGQFRMFRLKDFTAAVGGGEPIANVQMYPVDESNEEADGQDMQHGKERLLQLGHSSILEQARLRQLTNQARCRRVDNDAYNAHIFQEPAPTPLPRVERTKVERAQRVCNLINMSRGGLSMSPDSTLDGTVGGTLSGPPSRMQTPVTRPGTVSDGGSGGWSTPPQQLPPLAHAPTPQSPITSPTGATLPNDARQTWSRTMRGFTPGGGVDPRSRQQRQRMRPRCASPHEPVHTSETMILTGAVDYKKLLQQQDLLNQEAAVRDTSYEKMLDSYHAIQNQVQRRLSIFIKNKPNPEAPPAPL